MNREQSRYKDHPDTTAQEAQRLLERIQRGPVTMAAEAPPGENREHREHRLAAEAGARRYAETLQAGIDAVDDQDLRRAALVARAVECAGWLSASTISGGAAEDRRAMLDLVAVGVFTFHPAEPGRHLACYRLAAPR